MSLNSDPFEPSVVEVETVKEDVLPRPAYNGRFAAGMLIYAVLALLAGLTLDGTIRIATWVFLGGLALKTWLAVLKNTGD